MNDEVFVEFVRLVRRFVESYEKDVATKVEAWEIVKARNAKTEAFEDEQRQVQKEFFEKLQEKTLRDAPLTNQ